MPGRLKDGASFDHDHRNGVAESSHTSGNTVESDCRSRSTERLLTRNPSSASLAVSAEADSARGALGNDCRSSQ